MPVTLWEEFLEVVPDNFGDVTEISNLKNWIRKIKISSIHKIKLPHYFLPLT